MQKIFVIKDKFEIDDKGIALVGVTENESLLFQKGDRATLKQPNFPELKVEVLGFELMRNCWSPHKPRNMCLLISKSVGINNIEQESEVWGNV